MATRHKHFTHRPGALLVAALGLGTMAATSLPSAASAAGNTAASFALGVLTVVGDGQDNTIAISRNAALLIRSRTQRFSVSSQKRR